MAEAIKDAVKDVKEGIKNLSAEDKEEKKKLQQQQPKKAKKAKTGSANGPDELATPPAYIDHRLKIFDELKVAYDAEIAAKPREDIVITLPDGSNKVGKSWETTPGDIARGIAKSLSERVFVAKVDGEVWDLERPLEKSCQLALLDFEDDDAKMVYWHSSAHVLGECAEKRWGCDLCIGPPLKEGGFYYEMRLPESAAVLESDYKPLESIANKAIKEKQVFQRLVLSKENLLEMFKSNPYKQHIIKDKIPDGTSTTIYRNGPFIDLCRGPHIPHTGRIKSWRVMKNSASYFLGDAANDSLQRIYGISFPDKKLMDEHLHYLEEAAKRDHRKIGTQQELFFFDESSPGSAFWLPHGTIIYKKLMAFLEEEYWKRGYNEVMTPNMFKADLWKTSGHWQHYQEDMFTFKVEKEDWALKPMNCPSHCRMFKHMDHSYRELPLRYADFGVLHRNEASGALTGLTRVRRFQQDDTHIFCTQDQIEEEVTGLFDFLRAVYGKFGFAFKMKLSTRPDNFLGKIEEWDIAEAKLSRALDEFHASGGAAWELNPGDGAFYGPKIDITISDALKRDFQCATIQLDFQLPQQFGLEYQTAEKKPAKAEEAPKEEAPKEEAPKEAAKDIVAKDPVNAKDEPAPVTRVVAPPKPGYARPVMIHRAIMGSFERFIGILCEHFGGKWPFWLSPRQVMIIPVRPSVDDYVKEVQRLFRAQKLNVDIDLGPNTMPKKILNAQMAGYNFTFVLGDTEKESRSVNIRNRDDQSKQKREEVVALDVALEKLCKLRDLREIENKM
ncbi:threonyl-trna synthetase [Venturia nashicola]|uniref:threonine--tRNA ligase n=1 Tax=Venturia nashicola TaxID=86259 RepID=A0A4Z1NKN8_9PEZI|nr:threonyl-trna synthetase [Venturia nashicola]